MSPFKTLKGEQLAWGRACSCVWPGPFLLWPPELHREPGALSMALWGALGSAAFLLFAALSAVLDTQKRGFGDRFVLSRWLRALDFPVRAA